MTTEQIQQEAESQYPIHKIISRQIFFEPPNGIEELTATFEKDKGWIIGFSVKTNNGITEKDHYFIMANFCVHGFFCLKSMEKYFTKEDYLFPLYSESDFIKYIESEIKHYQKYIDKSIQKHPYEL